MLRAAIDPRLEQRVGHGQDDRADKDAQETESEQTANHAGKNQEQREVRAFLAGKMDRVFPALPGQAPAERTRRCLAYSRSAYMAAARRTVNRNSTSKTPTNHLITMAT
ncbi:MAG TPA: hypothetical protein VMS64_01785 [Candidatus Methylomirabilis sp.]|nr:hypothetical protein [Candidatus Methylomirabilis sp.]